MTNSPKAYNELVGVLLDEENRKKFEWAIGCLLTGGPRRIVVLRGPSMTGKTTLINIVRKMVSLPLQGGFAPQAYFMDVDYFRKSGFKMDEIDTNAFVFVESNRPYDESDNTLIIDPTGERLPVNKHYVLTNAVDDELFDIAEHCIDVYHNGPRAVYNQENNR